MQLWYFSKPPIHAKSSFCQASGACSQAGHGPPPHTHCSWGGIQVVRVNRCQDLTGLGRGLCVTYAHHHPWCALDGGLSGQVHCCVSLHCLALSPVSHVGVGELLNTPAPSAQLKNKKVSSAPCQAA